MADASTCELTPSHAPKPKALKSFAAILPTMKSELVRLRRDHDKHERQYFEEVASLSDNELAAFGPDDLVAVRVGKVAYGLILFGKVRLPKAPGGYVFVRWFVGGEDTDGDGKVEEDEGEVEVKLHSFYTEDKGDGAQGRRFRAIMGERDELEFFSE